MHHQSGVVPGSAASTAPGLRATYAGWSRDRKLVATAAALWVFALVLWGPSLSTPWWGDDYQFLRGAHVARQNGESWFSAFWPDVRFQFWRPLGHELYWRFVEGTLHANPRAAHLSNLILWFLGCISVGGFAATLATLRSWRAPFLCGALAAGLYAVHAMHFTPLHWISSDDSLFIILWTTLALTAWVAAPTRAPRLRVLLCATLPFLQFLALASKESGAMIPLLMLCVSAFNLGSGRPGRPETIAWAVCAVLVVAWLPLHEHFTYTPPSEYALAFGGNIARNAALLAAWMLNVPREALRMIVEGSRTTGALWALAAAVPAGVFLLTAGRAALRQSTAWQIAAVALFVVIGYGPYFVLARQSYEYYAQVSFVLPAVLLARGLMLSNRAVVAAAFLAISSFVTVEGSRWAEYPALISRARWAESRLSALPASQVSAPLHVRVGNPHRFYAIGVSGLAWRFGLSESDIALVTECPESGRVLEEHDGDLRWTSCAAD